MKVTTMKGKTIDLTTLAGYNTAIAVGNAKMNARGDIIGPGGVIAKSREEVVKDYYQNNPKAVTASPISLNDISQEILTPGEAMKRLDAATKEKAQPKRKIIDTDD